VALSLDYKLGGLIHKQLCSSWNGVKKLSAPLPGSNLKARKMKKRGNEKLSGTYPALRSLTFTSRWLYKQETEPSSLGSRRIAFELATY
jgi:hypothetical protein